MEAAAPLAFDVYGTLGDPRGMADALHEYTEDAEQVGVRWRTHQLEISWLLTVMERYDDFRAVTRFALQCALEEAQVQLSGDDLDAIIGHVDRLELYDDAVPALDALLESGHRLAILSNGSPSMLETLLKEAGIDDRFDAVISVHEVGAFKPAPAVYRHAASRLGSEIGETWLISGNPFDAAGAKAAGMRVAKIERTGSFLYPFVGPPDLVCDSLASLPGELARISA